MKARENTIVVSSRLDARDLATVVLAWEQVVGGAPRSMSWLVREVVGSMADLMVQKLGESVKVETHQQAFDVIDGAELSVRSARALKSITKGMQAEGLSPSQSYEQAKPSGPTGVDDDEMLLFAIKSLRSQGLAEEAVKAQVAPLASKLEQQAAERERDRLASERQAHQEMLARFKQAKELEQEQITLSPEQKLENFERSVVERLGEEWGGPMHEKLVRQIQTGYQTLLPGITEEEFSQRLVALVELAEPAISSRTERDRERFEAQEREKKARREAKAIVG